MRAFLDPLRTMRQSVASPCCIAEEPLGRPAAEQTVQMQFLPASGYAFPVARTKSWHSAANATEVDGERVSMMVTYYLDESLGDRFTRRLTRAALLFGVHPRL